MTKDQKKYKELSLKKDELYPRAKAFREQLLKIDEEIRLLNEELCVLHKRACPYYILCELQYGSQGCYPASSPDIPIACRRAASYREEGCRTDAEAGRV